MLQRIKADRLYEDDRPFLLPEGVFLSPDEGVTLHRAFFVNGNPRVAFAGEGSFEGFHFLLSHSKREAAQLVAGTFIFDGPTHSAADALVRAGFKQRGGMHHGVLEFRSAGSFLTGANSAHFLLHELSVHPSPNVATGEFHFGEHNPYSPLGWIFHWLLEARR